MIVERGIVSCRVLSASDVETAWIRDYLSFPDPKAHWHGGDTHVRMFNSYAGSFPAGFLPMVVKAAGKADIKVEVADKRVPPCSVDVNADLAWLRDYQRGAVDAAVTSGSGIVWASTGCLAGDTKITINRGGNARVLEIKTVVARLCGNHTTNKRNGRAHGWDLTIPTYCQSVRDDGYVCKNRIIRAWSSGVKHVFKVVTEAGHVVRATEDHRFLTPSGTYVRLRELSNGDRIMAVDWPKSSHARREKTQYPFVSNMRNHPYRVKINTERSGHHERVATHRLVAEAYKTGCSLPEFVGRIMLGMTDGMTFLDPKVWHVHHKDRDSSNYSLDNLEILPADEHLRKHAVEEESWKRVSGKATPYKIKSIEHAGDEETFDMEMDAPLHNYVANEIVVHNSGKTEIATALTRVLPCRWLFVVHRTSLAQQAAERYDLRNREHGVDLPPAGVIGDGKWSTSERLTCATFQTLAAGIKSSDKKVTDLLKSTQGVIVDECHVLPSTSFSGVLRGMPNAYHRFGLSGTPLARGDRRSLLAVAAVGPVIHRIRTDFLVDSGVLARPKIVMVEVRGKSDKATYQGVYADAIVRGKKRNATLVEAARRAEKPSMLFVKEVSHGHLLVKMLERAGLKAAFVWGEQGTEKRTALVRDLVSGRLDVVVASVVFQEGIDVPSLRSVIIGSSGKSVIAALQRIGRGMRKTDGKDTFLVYDIADRGCGCDRAAKALGTPGMGLHTGCKWLEKHTAERRKAYVQEGHNVTEEQWVIPGVSDDP